MGVFSRIRSNKSSFLVCSDTRIHSSLPYAFVFKNSVCHHFEQNLILVLEKEFTEYGRGYLIYVRGEFIGVLKTIGEKTFFCCVNKKSSKFFQGGLQKSWIYSIPTAFYEYLRRNYPIKKGKHWCKVNIKSSFILFPQRPANPAYSIYARTDSNNNRPFFQVADYHKLISNILVQNSKRRYDVEINNFLDFFPIKEFES